MDRDRFSFLDSFATQTVGFVREELLAQRNINIAYQNKSKISNSKY